MQSWFLFYLNDTIKLFNAISRARKKILFSITFKALLFAKWKLNTALNMSHFQADKNRKTLKW